MMSILNNAVNMFAIVHVYLFANMLINVVRSRFLGIVAT